MIRVLARIPEEILQCGTVTREINFTSTEEIEHFRLEQRVYLNGSCFEGTLCTVHVAYVKFGIQSGDLLLGL